MLSSRMRDAVIAACGAVVIFLLAWFLPDGLPRITLAIGVVVFLLYLYLVPRFWYRRIVGIVLFLWAGAIATPSFFTEAQLQDNAILRVFVEGGGWPVHATLCLAFIASLVVSTFHEQLNTPKSAREVTGGDTGEGDKVVQKPGRDVYHSEGPMNIHHGDTIDGDYVAGNKTVIVPLPPKLFLNQIQSPTVDFVGREKEIKELMAAFEDTGQGAVIVSARGMGGVGKTELAKVLAKRFEDRFPDGQLSFNLRGASDGDTTKPATASEALSHVIRTFLPDAKLPEGIDSLQGMYHSVLHGKRVLLLMDNALNAGQLARLVPPPDGCALIVTSRQKFTLAGMNSIDLDTLSPEEARDLLLDICSRIGEKADVIAERCGYLPLALRLAGSALETQQILGVEEYLDDLNTEQGRLAALDEHKDATLIGIEASLGMSYRLLGEELQQFWRALSVFLGDFDVAAAASVGQSKDAKATQKTMSALHAASMVERDKTTGRFRLHDLARDYARAQLSDAERTNVDERHAAHYLEVLGRTDELYKEGGESMLRGLAFFDRERGNIAAGQAWAAAHRETNEIAERLCNGYPKASPFCINLRLHPREQIVWFDAALEAARTLKDRKAEGIHLGNLGLTHTMLGEQHKAIEYYEQALGISREIGDRLSEANGLGNLGLAYMDLSKSHSEIHKAIEFYEQQLAIVQEIKDRRIEGNALNNMGLAYTRLGELQKAIELFKQILVISKKLGDRLMEGNALGNIGNVYVAELKPHKAIEFYEQQLAIVQEIKDRTGEGRVSFNIALQLLKSNRVDDAVIYAEKAVEIFKQIEGPGLADARALFEHLRK